MHKDHKVQLLHIILLKKITYVKNYDEQTKWMYFLIEDDDLLEKYNTIWNIYDMISEKNLIAILPTIKVF